jgi:hypothetical protein
MALKVPKIKSEVLNGKMKFNANQKNILDKWLMCLNGKEVEVVIKIRRNKRTIPQNSYYWGVVLDLIAESTGYTTQELHEFFKRLFLKKVIKIGGVDYEVSESTSKLNTEQFSDYIEKIKKFAVMKLDLHIPSPDEIDYENEFVIDEKVDDIDVKDIPKFWRL